MKKLLLCLLVGVMSLTSCELSDPDGLADPMKWSTVPSGLKNGELKVEAEGGSSLFACKNYKSFWISSVKEEGKFKENTSYKEFDGGWYLVKIGDNELKVIINRNETNASRSFTVCVEARLRRIQVRTRCSKTIILQHLYTKKRVFIMRQCTS